MSGKGEFPNQKMAPYHEEEYQEQLLAWKASAAPPERSCWCLLEKKQENMPEKYRHKSMNWRTQP